VCKANIGTSASTEDTVVERWKKKKRQLYQPLPLSLFLEKEFKSETTPGENNWGLWEDEYRS